MKTKPLTSKLLLLTTLFLFTMSCSKKETQDMVAYPTPSVSSISPKIGIATTEVTVTGENFGTDASVAKVYFGNRIGTITSISDNIIKVKAPAGFASVTVDVKVALGTSTSDKVKFVFASKIPPTIDFISPTFFTNSTVVIKGSEFSSVAEDNIVKFGDIRATVVSATSTMLKVTTPDLGTATSAQVTVKNADKTSLPQGIMLDVDQQKIANFAWTSTTTRPGLIYKKGELALFGGSTRSIYILDVTLSATNTLGIGVSNPYAATVTMANTYNAFAAVNAGYFKLANTYDKDPYIRINGVTVQSGDADVAQVFTNSALIINNNIASVKKFGDNSKFLNQIAAGIPVSEASNMIVSGPMLVTSDVLESPDLTNSHNTSITSRTGLGVSADGKRVIMVVVDSGGGFSGVSTPQLAKIMQALGSVDAMNLDGGGSSTMFVKDQGLNGLVNLPYGIPSQRSVRSIIYVK